MSFDIASFDVATKSDSGVAMKVKNPRTGQTMTGPDGSPVTITLRGRSSEVYREHEIAVRDRRLEAARAGRNTLSAEELEVELTDLLTLCTVDWSFDVMDGQPFPCTQQNARKLWSDRRYIPIREQATAFISDDANFFSA